MATSSDKGTVLGMTPSRQVVLDQLKALQRAVENDDVQNVGTEMETLLLLLKRAFSAPGLVVVTTEHLLEAVAVTSAYADLEGDHTLLADVLYRMDDRISVDAPFRLGVISALAQLVFDALTTSVIAAATDLDSDGDIDSKAVTIACRELLQRIALIRAK